MLSFSGPDVLYNELRSRLPASQLGGKAGIRASNLSIREQKHVHLESNRRDIRQRRVPAASTAYSEATTTAKHMIEDTFMDRCGTGYQQSVIRFQHRAINTHHVAVR